MIAKIRHTHNDNLGSMAILLERDIKGQIKSE